jgi:hypothetical protein
MSNDALYPKRIALGIALAAALSGVALAQPPGPGGWGGPVSFDAIDRDGNGVVTADEMARHHAERVAARAAEGRLLRHASSAPRIQDWDRDGNGVLSRDELRAGQNARFAARGWGGQGSALLAPPRALARRVEPHELGAPVESPFGGR